MSMSKEEYHQHLASEHRLSAFAEYIREIVLGGNDGIITTFAVVAGFSGANGGDNLLNLSIGAVLLFGLANLFADGASMGIGNFLSMRADKSVYANIKNKERHEIQNSPEQEYQETIYILKARGFTPEQATQIADLYRQNPEYWLRFMMNEELEMPNPEGENAFLIALATFLSFVFFGFIPLIPFIFFKGADHLFGWSVAASLVALIGIGIIRAITEKGNWIKCLLEMLIVGGSAGVIAYVVGLFFRG